MHRTRILPARLVRTGPEDRLAGPSWRIWPSDHAGLALHLLLPPAE
jgi:hypothetical protein